MDNKAPLNVKWQAIAGQVGDVRPGEVYAVWCALLGHASESGQRGSTNGFNPHLVAAALQLPVAKVAQITQVFEEPTWGMIVEGLVVSFDRHNPKAENSTGRVRAFRERQAALRGGEGPGQQPVPKETPIVPDALPETKVKRFRSGRNAATSTVTILDSPPVAPPAGGGGDTPPEPARGEAAGRTPAKPTPAQVAEGFEGFWRAYPKRVGKVPAETKYRQVAARVGVARIAKGLASQLARWERDGAEMQFVPNPSTWLHQGRFDDEDPGPPAATVAGAAAAAPAEPVGATGRTAGQLKAEGYSADQIMRLTRGATAEQVGAPADRPMQAPVAA